MWYYLGEAAMYTRARASLSLQVVLCTRVPGAPVWLMNCVQVHAPPSGLRELRLKAHTLKVCGRSPFSVSLLFGCWRCSWLLFSWLTTAQMAGQAGPMVRPSQPAASAADSGRPGFGTRRV